MLKLQGISKSFASKQTLEAINFFIPTGKTHVLMGSSGSGKTTLIRTIIGLLKPDAGQVLIDGLNQNSMAPTAWARQIGYVPQDGGLFPHLTGAKNVTLVANILNWDQKRIEARLEELCRSLTLDPSLLKRFPQELSGGQRQRISLMRASFLDPKLLMLDEPLGALDPIIRFEVQKELRDIFRKLGKTVLLVTHDLNEARYFGDELSLLWEGRIIQTGTFDEMLQSPAHPFVTKFMRVQGLAGES